MLIGANEVIVLIFFLAFIIPAIFFLITQQNTIKAIQPQNRSISPGEVWLQLIPLFNLVWQFIVVNRIADSIERELASQNRFSFDEPDGYGASRERRPTADIGIAACVLQLCGIIPIIGILAGLAGLICRIVYWVKIAEYKRLILSKSYMVSPPSVP